MSLASCIVWASSKKLTAFMPENKGGAYPEGGPATLGPDVGTPIPTISTKSTIHRLSTGKVTGCVSE